MRTKLISILILLALACPALADNLSTFVVADSIVIIVGDRATVNALVANAGGTTINNPYLLANHTMAYLTMRQIRDIQGYVEYIFPASADMILQSPTVGCASAAVTTAVSPETAKIVSVYPGVGWDGPGLNHVDLTYTLGYMTPNGGYLTSAQASQRAITALNKWSEYASIDFSPGLSPFNNYDIHIKFATGDHGDGQPFVGELAHSAYPPQLPNQASSYVYGDTHMNNFYLWADNVSYFGNPYDLYHVLLHETGHSLGLAHSDDPLALMYPYYDGRKQAPNSSDVDSLQSLYALRTPPEPLPNPGSREARGGATAFTATSYPFTTTVSDTAIVITGSFSGGTSPYVLAKWNNSLTGQIGTLTVPSFSVTVPLAIGTNVISFVANDSLGATASTISTVTRTDRNR